MPKKRQKKILNFFQANHKSQDKRKVPCYYNQILIETAKGELSIFLLILYNFLTLIYLYNKVFLYIFVYRTYNDILITLNKLFMCITMYLRILHLEQN